MKPFDVYIYGDVNIDLMIPEVSSIPTKGQEVVIPRMYTCIGGGAALTTLGLARLGLKVCFEGQVGKDLYGTFIREQFQKAGVDTGFLRDSDKETGISLSFTDQEDRGFITSRGSNEELDLDQVTEEHLAKASHVHVTGYGGKERHAMYQRFVEKASAEGRTVSLDLGWDDTGDWYQGIRDLFPYLDVLFMNEVEAAHYLEVHNIEDACKLSEQLDCMLVIKCGKKGSYVCQGTRQYVAGVRPVAPVDPTGAGDSFNAGFLYGFLREKPLEECLRYGNICGGLSTTAYGGNTAFPGPEVLGVS
ncbi:MAG: carbohydrate kinase family protein [Lachnospiraceae bacterium]|nr:carbohydrate kinase family protein [Lachnospiraceae bacterium]